MTWFIKKYAAHLRESFPRWSKGAFRKPIPDVLSAINSRSSATSYDASRPLSRADIHELIELATQAPSAFHGQNWKFIAVSSDEGRSRLAAAAFGQVKILEAPVTFIVVGKTNIHYALPQALKPSLDAGTIDYGIYSGLIKAANNIYAYNSGLQRDEAIRSGALAAMTLMLAAQGKGLASSPMIGFMPLAVADHFNLASNEIPVLLVSVGYGGDYCLPKKTRRPVKDVLSYA